MAHHTDIAGMTLDEYHDLLDNLRKDLQLDLSIDAQQHTGNDVPGALSTSATGCWLPLSPFYVHSWGTQAAGAYPGTLAKPWSVPMMFLDANGWVTLRGLIAAGAAYSNGTPAAVPLNLPTSLLPPTVEGFTQWTQDAAGNNSMTMIEVWPAVYAAGNPTFGGNVFAALTVGGGTNNGAVGTYFSLSGIRWNCRA